MRCALMILLLAIVSSVIVALLETYIARRDNFIKNFLGCFIYVLIFSIILGVFSWI